MNRNQKTIANAGFLSGVGIHTGLKTTVHFRPATVNSGIQFSKNGVSVRARSLPGQQAGPRPSQGGDTQPIHDSIQRCTSIGEKELKIQTVEHLLAAVRGLEIDNIGIDVEGSELPALDGSAAPFVRFLKELGIVEQSGKKEVFKIAEPIFCHEKNKVIAIYPSQDFSISYTLDYEHPYLKTQTVDFTLSPDVFEKEIAPARTFCAESEAESLRTQGFGLGADFQNTVVISKKGVIQNSFRFPDECARHKVLDILGDLSLLGFSVVGRVVGIRSGHALNRKLVQRISAQNQERNPMNKEMTIEEIKKTLPHRYPFLLVDKILDIKEKTAVGIKNVSANEPFFQGHFPERPVMPGVLIIEAMAQVGGALMLSKSENRGKLAYLVSITNARFRKVVVPGDQLRLEIEILKMKSKVGVVKGVAKVNGEEVCDAEFMFTLVD